MFNSRISVKLIRLSEYTTLYSSGVRKIVSWRGVDIKKIQFFNVNYYRRFLPWAIKLLTPIGTSLFYSKDGTLVPTLAKF